MLYFSVLSKKITQVQLNLLKAYFKAYEDYLQENQTLYNEVLWDVQTHFKANWDVEAPDFSEMFNKSVQSNISRRLWKFKSGDAKKRMLDFAEIDTEFVRRLFKGLMNHEKDLSYRISHFQFGCQVLMDEYRKLNNKSIETDHYHLNNHMPTLYLSLDQPTKYPVYYSDLFIQFMGNVGVKDLPHLNDYDRFYKVSQTLFKLISQEESLMKVCLEILPEKYHEVGFCQFITTDFYRWVAKKKLVIG